MLSSRPYSINPTIPFGIALYSSIHARQWLPFSVALSQCSRDQKDDWLSFLHLVWDIIYVLKLPQRFSDYK